MLSYVPMDKLLVHTRMDAKKRLLRSMLFKNSSPDAFFDSVILRSWFWGEQSCLSWQQFPGWTWIMAEHLVSRTITDSRGDCLELLFELFGRRIQLQLWHEGCTPMPFNSLCLCLQLWRGLTWKLPYLASCVNGCPCLNLSCPSPHLYCVNCLSSLCILKKIICRHLHYDYYYYYYFLVLHSLSPVCFLFFLWFPSWCVTRLRRRWSMLEYGSSNRVSCLRRPRQQSFSEIWRKAG